MRPSLSLERIDCSSLPCRIASPQITRLIKPAWIRLDQGDQEEHRVSAVQSWSPGLQASASTSRSRMPCCLSRQGRSSSPMFVLGLLAGVAPGSPVSVQRHSHGVSGAGPRTVNCALVQPRSWRLDPYTSIMPFFCSRTLFNLDTQRCRKHRGTRILCSQKGLT